MSLLSGGNQQKVVTARALASDPRVLVMFRNELVSELARGWPDHEPLAWPGCPRGGSAR